MKKRCIIGHGAFAKEVYALCEDESIEFFVDDHFIDKDTPCFVGPISNLDLDTYEIVIAIADPSSRKKISEKLGNNAKYFNVIHKSVIFYDNNHIIGNGSVICPNVVISTNVVLGKHSHIYIGTNIGHDFLSGDYFTTAMGVNVAGNVTVGDCVYMGNNSTVKQKINICSNVTIGLNAGIVKNIEKEGTYIGTPAKCLIP
jgi:sugar O-acyltransferase (sialic acid O-acetyltransferase NeuD family)